MTTSATAAVLRDAEAGFQLEQISLGPLAPGEILVRIAGTGMCHTDLAARDVGLLAQLGPIVLGHEGAGVVEEVGESVEGIAVGDHVVLSFDSCGQCPRCRLGRPAYCADFMLRNASGRRADFSAGAQDAQGNAVAARWFGQSSFASHAIATVRNVVVVDRALPLEILGALGCGLQTGAGSVINVMGLGPGQSIAVFGAGGVGLAGVSRGTLEFAPMTLAGKTVTYAFEGSAVPQEFIPRLIALWRAGLFPFDRLVRTYPLARIAEAEADSYAGTAIKPVLLPEPLSTLSPSPAPRGDGLSQGPETP